VIQCLTPSAVTSLGSPAKLSQASQQGALSAWTSECKNCDATGANPVASLRFGNACTELSGAGDFAFQSGVGQILRSASARSRMACRAAARAQRPAFALRGFGAAALLASRAKAGGGRRTRTFEVIRRLIYSQLPLPLGTLPRSTASQPTRRNGGKKAMDDVKTWDPITGSPVGAFMAESPLQSQPRPAANKRPQGVQIAIIRNP
jgi:hypothetical protein